MRSLLICAVLACFAGILAGASAQTGTICLYADPQGTQCSISDTAPGLLSVYVIHDPLSTPSGAGAIEFSAPKPDCMVGATWVADSSPLPMSSIHGNSQTGITLAYGDCISAPTHVLTVQYMVSGSSQSDCAYAVIPRPELAVISVVTCGSDYVQAVGGVTYVNSTIACQCAEPTGPPILRVSPASLDFGVSTNSLDFAVINDGGGVLTWNITDSAPWLSVSPASGTGYSTVRASVSRTGLPEGVHNTDITVSSNGGVILVHVSMEVRQNLSVYPSSLWFDTRQVEQSLYVRNRGPGTLEWTITWDQPWLSVYPATGVNYKEVRVRVNRAGLAGGTYTGTVTVTGGGEQVQVPVTMLVATGVPGAGTIGLFADPQAASCNLFDQSAGLMTFYVVHVLTSGAAAAQFGAPIPSCMTGASYLGESSPFGAVIGNSQTGVAIGYGACLSGPIHLLTIRLFVQGLSEPCCLYPVIPALGYGDTKVWMVDCDENELEAASAYAVVNPIGACQCSSVKTEDATWGKIKSLYSDE
jgi:hypothetical protein